MREPKNGTQHWHQRAQQMRLMAQHTADPDVQAQMMQIVEAYEAVAEKSNGSLMRFDARWRVDYLGKKGSHLGTVEAASEREAIAEAAKEFNIPPARQNKLAVTKIDGDQPKNGATPRRR